MNRHVHPAPIPLAGAVLCVLACTAHSAPQDDSVLTLGTVRAEARAAGERSLPVGRVFSSVDVLGADLVQDQRVDYSWELFARAPGVQVTQFKMGTDAGRISFRGFNGEGRINAVKLLIDGVPSNDNAGGMPYLDAVFPLDIAAIEIVRGTNDPRYGLNAIAGDVNVVTRSGGDEGALSVTAGSFGTRDVQLAKGFEQGPWSQDYFAGWRDSDGYREHARAIKRTFAGKWFYADPEDRWRAGLSTRYFHNDAQESGYLAYADAVARPRSSPAYSDQDRSERQTVQTALHLDGRIGADWNWNAKAYVNRYTNDRVVKFTAAGARQERYNDETHRGLLANATWTPQVAWAREFALEGGVDAQWQDNVARRFGIVDGARGTVLRDWAYALDTRGAYVQAVIRPGERLKLVPAYRIDRVHGDFDDVANGARYPVYGYGTIRQPKFSAAYRLGETSTAYANWGRSFQIGTGNGAYRTGANDLAPSINTGWEAGLKFRPGPWADARLAYWEQRASGEVATVLGVNGSVAVGDVANVGKTLRRGWDAQFNLQPGERWRAWLAYSRQKATIVAPDPGAPDTRGKEIENVPRWLANAGVEWQAGARLKLSAWGNGQGDYYVERTNTLGRYGGYVLGNLGATWTPDARNAFSLQLKNVTDRFYAYAWYDSGSSGYSPGDGRAFYVNWTRRL
ncbi:TonB-dependent receptor [[Pseudomonas] boreopolis]|uniref:TonB-dependent receptor n=1 Tax=Xanthomonas boreopolis TaxID=86183 RepID=UPI003D492B96